MYNMLSLAERFKFEAGALAVCVKVDLHEICEECWMSYVTEKYFITRAYLEEHEYEIVEYSSGMHMKGKAGKTHAHIHYIVYYRGKGNSIHSNESARKSRFIEKVLKDDQHPVRLVTGLKPGQISFTNVSFRFQHLDINSIHYDVLSYPLKEGNLCHESIYSMEDEYVVALLEYAVAIYKGQTAMHERRERNEEKTQCRKEAMLKCAKEYRHLYDNWMDMALVLEKYYLKPLPFREKMKPQEFKVNCQIIAQELEIASYVRDFF